MEHISSVFKNHHKRNSFFASLAALIVLIAVAILLGLLVYHISNKSVTPAPTFEVSIIKEESKTPLLVVNIKRPTGLPEALQAKADVWVDGMKKDIQELVASLGDTDTFGLPYTLDVIEPEFYITGDTVSVVMVANMYTGGAHGIQTYLTMTYDIRSGEEMQLSDIVGYEVSYEKLSSILTPMVRAHLDQKLNDAGVADAGEVFFEEGLEPKAENFSLWYLEEGNIVFLFPPYQVAPYALGLQRIPVPIEVFLKPLS